MVIDRILDRCNLRICKTRLFLQHLYFRAGNFAAVSKPHSRCRSRRCCSRSCSCCARHTAHRTATAVYGESRPRRRRAVWRPGAAAAPALDRRLSRVGPEPPRERPSSSTRKKSLLAVRGRGRRRRRMGTTMAMMTTTMTGSNRKEPQALRPTLP